MAAHFELDPVLAVPMFPAVNRGAAVLRWILSWPAGGEWYGYLTDADLRRADAVAIVAVAPRGCHPAALETVSRVRQRIARVLAARAQEAAAPARGATTEPANEPQGPPAPDARLEAVRGLAESMLSYLHRLDGAPPDDDGDGGRPVRRPVPPPHNPPPAGRMPAPLTPVPVRRQPATADDGF